MLERKKEEGRFSPSCRVLLRQPTVCGRVLWEEAKSDECSEERKRDFVQSTSQNYGEAAGGVVHQLHRSFVLLAIQDNHRIQGFTKAWQ